MLTLLLSLQLALPLGLIIWLLAAPPRSWVGFGVQLAATGLFLLALSRLGLWLLPPWWAPRAYAVLLFVAAIVAFRRRRPFAGTWPASIGSRIVTVGFAGLGVFSVVMLFSAWSGRRPPEGSPVELAVPFDDGRYLVLNGGNAIPINAHLKQLDTTVAKFAQWRGNAHAVDLVAIDPWGLRASGVRPTDPAGYRIFGVVVVAPCAGHVVVAVDGFPDLPVPEIDSVHRAGNHVILRCEEVDVVLAHLRTTSLKVAIGDFVQLGQPLGEVGNSGASDEPHLHIHAQRPGTRTAPLSGDPLPIRIGGHYLVRGDRIRVSP